MSTPASSGRRRRSLCAGRRTGRGLQSVPEPAREWPSQAEPEILNQIAKGLHIQALYVQAGLIEDRGADSDVPAAIRADSTITGRQRQVMIDIYESFRKEDRPGSREAQPTQPAELALGEAVPSLTGRHTGLQGRVTMTLTSQVRKITESKPFYALAGAGAYAIENLRRLRARRGDLRETAKDLPVKTREAVAKDLPEKAREYADTATAKLNELYDDLADRGREIVSKVSREAAHELEDVSESAKPATTPEAGKAPGKEPIRGPKTTSKV